MANRIATAADVIYYNGKVPLGSVIMDEATHVQATGRKIDIRDFGSNPKWASLSGMVKVFYDFQLAGQLCEIRLSEGINNAPLGRITGLTISAIPGQKWDVKRTSFTHTSYTCCFQGAIDYVLHGASDAYPGMRDGMDSSKFIFNRFGVVAESFLDATRGCHMFLFDVATNGVGSINICDVASLGGFTSFRSGGSGYTGSIDMTFKRCFLAQGVGGEGFYLGRTAEGNGQRLRNLWIEDCIIAERAAEAIQVQNLKQATLNSRVRNCVIFNSAVNWKKAFEPGQDTSNQIVAAQGKHIFENIIVHGSPSHAYNLFGSTMEVANSEPIIIQNVIITKSKTSAIYAHPSTIRGLRWIFRNIWMQGFTKERMLKCNDEKVEDFLINAHAGTDPVDFVDIHYDDTQTNIFENPEKFGVLGFTNEGTLPDIEFVNSGYYPDEVVSNWQLVWGNWLVSPDDSPVSLQLKEIVINIVDGVDFSRYKVLIPHLTSVLTRPDLNPVDASGNPLFLRLTWDTNGVRNDMPGHDPNTAQSILPPWDLRLKKNSFWSLLFNGRVGLLSNPHNDTYTQIQWYRRNNEFDTQPVPIPGAKFLKYKRQEVDYGKQISMWVKPKVKAGPYAPDWAEGTWIDVPLPPQNELYFQGDMSAVTIIPSGSNLIFNGWNDLQTHSYVQSLRLNNIGASPTYANQNIQLDPANTGRNVMYATIIDDDPGVVGTTRAQMTIEFKPTTNLAVYHTSHRMYLSPDVDYLRNYSPAIYWFELFEVWNQYQNSWAGDPGGSARWGLYINKASGVGSPLFWMIKAETMQPVELQLLWQYTNMAAIPLGQWFTLDFYMKRGEGVSGNLVVTITVDGGSPYILFNINNSTIYPGYPNIPISYYQPFKLYLDDAILDWLKSNNKRISAYYNDFKWYKT